MSSLYTLALQTKIAGPNYEFKRKGSSSVEFTYKNVEIWRVSA